MDKMDGKTMDIVAENVDKLKELFPEAFTEDGTAKNAKGAKIDWDVLREVLGEYVTDKDERYSFTWNGKSKARMIAQTPSTGTLRPCKEESVDWDTTQNIFIEGDNLEVLKLLQKSYHKKVKMIYIDPPYNTGKDFVYKDNFKDNIKNYKEITGQVDGEGRNLSNNPETSGRYHTDWLNMMYPRLKLARNLLKDDGVIFISIDEVEVSNLTRICDEIFGEENRLGTIVWKKKTNGNNMGYIPPVHDYFMAYAKVASDSCLLGFPLSDEFIEKTYSNPDNDPRGSWTTSDLSANHVGPYFEITNPETGEKFPPPKGRYWVFGEEDVKKRIADGRIIFGKSGNGRPIQKKFLNERSSMRRKAESWWDAHGMNEDGTSELGKLIAPKVFTHPKPSLTIKNLSNICTQGNDLILDFFAGSGTTAHAVMQLNAEDGGNRKFILVQLPEKTDVKSEAFKAGYETIAEISKERIRRAAAKIKAELEPRNTRNTQKKDEDLLNFGEADPSVSSVSSVVKKELDLGFKVFKLDSTNIKPWEVDFDLIERTLEDFISNIKTDRREEDVLYEILLKYGLSLDLPIEQLIIDNGKLIMKDKNNCQLSTVNSQLSNAPTVYSIGYGALIICLSDNITLELVESIASLKEELNPEIMRVVFKDSGFKDDVVKTNAVQILKQAGIVDVRSL